MEVRPFNRERELKVAEALLYRSKEQEFITPSILRANFRFLLNIDEDLEFNEIPIQRDMERNPEERKP